MTSVRSDDARHLVVTLKNSLRKWKHKFTVR
jgi:hypothetical protein